MTNSVQLRLRRGTASQVASFIGAQAEIVIDTDNNRVVVQDGSTAGGHALAKLDDVGVLTPNNIDDTNFIAAASNLLNYYTALTAARTFTLMAANALAAGTVVILIDATGNCSATLAITIAAAGSDKIAGNASVKMTSPWQELRLRSNGTNLWTLA